MNGSIRIGEWLLTPASHRLTRGDATHVLRAKLVQILVCLAEEPGRVLQRDELLDRIWPGIIVTDDSLTRGISELRKILADPPDAPRYIETIRKGGYRLIAPVTIVPAEEARHVARPGKRRLDRPRLAALGLSLAGAWILWAAWSAEELPGVAHVVEPRPLTTLVGRETDPAVSPDGTRVAFAWGGVAGDNYDIYVKLIGADGLLRLTEDSAADVHPAWSPDGRSVAFLRSSEDGSGVHVVPATGGPAERLVATPDWIQGLDWSPDGRSLIYSARNDGQGAMRIQRLSLEERRVTVISQPPSRHSDHSPVFSPDGSTIAFVRSASAVDRDSVVLADLEGDELRTLEVEGLPIRGIEWVADDQYLILAAEVEDSARLFRLSVADGSLTELPMREEQVTYPSMSSDGTTLVYEDARPRQRLHRVRLAGREGASDFEPHFEPILATTHSDRDADYSPDGTRLAFVSDRSGPFELWLADADGGRPRRLTDSGADDVGRPRWSPDGERIAYLLTSHSESSLWITSTDGSGKRVLAFEAGMVLSGWSRDGTSLYVATDLGGSWEALRIRVDDAQVRRVAEAGAIAAMESPDGRWLYFSKSIERGIWRTPIEGGEFEVVLASFDPVFSASWLPTDDGLVFAEWRDFRTRLSLLDLGTRETSTLVEVPWSHAPVFTLTASGDELVITTTDQGGSDLNVVENFVLSGL